VRLSGGANASLTQAIENTSFSDAVFANAKNLSNCDYLESVIKQLK
jgi:hypothetical protein